jgi:hypothetical protein
VNATASSQTGSSRGLAPAPELSPLRGSGCRNLASDVCEQASPFFQLLPNLPLLNLTHTTREWKDEEVSLVFLRGGEGTSCRAVQGERIDARGVSLFHLQRCWESKTDPESALCRG